MKIKKIFVFDFRILGPSPLHSQTPKTPILTLHLSKSVTFEGVVNWVSLENLT